MTDKKKARWDIMLYPLITFALLVFIPLWPTVWLLVMDANKIWLILTIGWAVAWYIGLVVWQESREQEK